MKHNPYESSRPCNPYVIFAWIGLLVALYVLFLNDARAASFGSRDALPGMSFANPVDLPEPAAWADADCQEMAAALLDQSQATIGRAQYEAGMALVDRAATARNCRLFEDHLEAEVGATSTAINACRSTLYLYPDRLPFIKRLCPL